MLSRFRRATEAASEIIGTLLLILIVTGAAASFAIFVQQQQEIVQENKAYATRVAAEDLRLLSLDPTDVEPDGVFDQLRADLVSAWNEDSVIDTFQVRQRLSGADTFVFPVKFDVVHSDGSTSAVDLSKDCPVDQVESGGTCIDSPGAPADRLVVPARDVLTLQFDLTVPGNFAGGVQEIRSDRPTSLAFLTRLGNRVAADVEPPVVVPTFSVDADQLTFRFDAADSFHSAWDATATPPVDTPALVQIDYYIAQSDVDDCQLYVADSTDVLEANAGGPDFETGWFHLSVDARLPDTSGTLVLRDESLDHDLDDADHDNDGFGAGEDGNPLDGHSDGTADDDTCVGPNNFDDTSPGTYSDQDGDFTATTGTVVTYRLIVLVTDQSGMVGRGTATVASLWDADSLT